MENSPHLRGAIGQVLITASGKTLLGADDKSGVAIAMATAWHLLRHPELKHGRIRLCFNPDEEIGRGVASWSWNAWGGCGVHTRRRVARGDRLGDVFGRRGDGDDPRRGEPSRLGDEQAPELFSKAKALARAEDAAVVARIEAILKAPTLAKEDRKTSGESTLGQKS